MCENVCPFTRSYGSGKKKRWKILSPRKTPEGDKNNSLQICCPGWNLIFILIAFYCNVLSGSPSCRTGTSLSFCLSPIPDRERERIREREMWPRARTHTEKDERSPEDKDVFFPGPCSSTVDCFLLLLLLLLCIPKCLSGGCHDFQLVVLRNACLRLHLLRWGYCRCCTERKVRSDPYATSSSHCYSSGSSPKIYALYMRWMSEEILR